jgi:hypothetical protein
MRLDQLRPVFESEGPFATAYTRTNRASATAAREIAVRARHAAERLAELEAPAQAGEMLEREFVRDTEATPERVLVWADDRVVFDATLPDTGVDVEVFWEPLPRLLTYVRAFSTMLPHVVAVVDREGGDLMAVDALGHVCDIESVEGTTFHIKKVGDAWSEARYVRHVEEHWKANAKDVAAAVEQLVNEVSAQRLVLAGDVRAREKLHQELSPRSASVATDIEAGGRGGSSAGIDVDAFDDAISRELAVAARHSLEAHCAEFNKRRGEFGAAAEGLSNVVAAAVEGKLETLLIGDDFDEEAEAWVGPEPTQLAMSRVDLAMLNADVASTAPAGSALLRAATMTDAEAVAVPEDMVRMRDSIGALLRY